MKRQLYRFTSKLILIGTCVLATIVWMQGCRNPLLSAVQVEVAAAVTLPEVSAVYPARDARDIPINTNTFTISFSKYIDSATVSGSTILITDADGTKVTGTFSVSSETITFAASGNLIFNKEYTVTITTGVKDTDGKSLAEEFTWSFVTNRAPDTTAPQISSVNINDGAEWINSLTLSLAITATDNYDTAEASSIAFIKINNSEWLPYTTILEHVLPAGEGSRTVAVTVKDAAGNTSDAYSATVSVDTVPPAIDTFFINEGRSATSTREMTVYIAANDTAGSGLAFYRYFLETDETAADWQVLPDSQLLLAEELMPDGIQNDDTFTYFAIVRDLAGNESAIASQTIRYDLLPPNLLFPTTPADDASNIPYNTSIVSVRFDDSIDINSINADSVVVLQSGNPLTGKFVFTDDGSIKHAILQLTELELQPNTDYIVSVSPDIRDVAGNSYGNNYTWNFRTGEAIDSTAPEGSIYPSGYDIPLPNGVYAVDTNNITIMVDAVDDYNGVYGMQFWGDGDLPVFMESAAWEVYTPTKAWLLDEGEKTYNLLYRLMDAASNISPSPIHVKVIYDITAPTISNLETQHGSAYSNNPSGLVSIITSAYDKDAGNIYTGSGIKEIKFSNDANMDDDEWENWSPVRTDWALDITAGDGPKQVHVAIRDYLNYSSIVSILDITWDTTPPSIFFDPDVGDFKITNTATTLSGTFTDTYGIASYSWEQESGPGTLTITNPGTADPTVSGIAGGSGDGVYMIRLTVVDNAGNQSVASVPFVWDTTAPAAMGTISKAGNYSNSSRPSVSWEAVVGADVYEVRIDGTLVDTIDTTSFSPASDLSEGSHTFRVTPKDLAGNTSAYTETSIFVDTIAPIINRSAVELLFNAQQTINFSDGTHGSVLEEGSGLAATEWIQLEGPGTVSFGSPTSLISTISASEHGYYGIQLQCTDLAGNVTYGNYTLNWDIVAPEAPQVFGIDRTPNTTPTWSWVSGGNGGSGNFQYRLTRISDNNVYVDWTAFNTATAFTSSILPGDNIADEDDEGGIYSYRLEVLERDTVGNTSEIGSHIIWVDSTYTAPPEVIVDGPSVQNTTTITWNWSSGAAQSGATYRYMVRKNNTAVPVTPPFDSLTWLNGTGGSVGDTVTLDSSTITTAAGFDDTWTILVEEYNTGLTAWNGKLGSHTVRVDRLGPSAPVMANVTSPTNDSTPTWSWLSSAGTDGTGYFRWNVDGGAWTETTATIATPAVLAHGSHTMYVQERDSLGNWGSSGSRVINVDIQAPSLTSISLKGGAGYTNSTSVAATISAVSETGMQMSFYGTTTAGWTTWESYLSSKTITIPSGEGNKYVYVKVRDSLGNESAYVYDTIILDQTAPSNVTYQLNGGQTYTPSLDVYLDVSATDNYASAAELELRYWYNGLWRDWQAFSARTLADVNFLATVGSKQVNIQLRDPAGNLTSSFADTIYLQIPSPIYAYKGYYSSGYTNVYFNQVTEDPGPAATQYRVYYTEDPAANPNTGSPLIYLGYTTSTYRQVSIPKGKILYFFVQASNSDTGGLGPYSLTSVYGYSSNVTVVYDKGDTTDEALAAKIKATLEDTILSGRSIVDGSTIVGTMPVWTVTLLPEDLISNSVYNNENTIYGDPVIITHGVTLADRQTTYDNRIRNIAASGRGLIAMGMGNIFIDRVNANWTNWGLPGTKPADIGYLKTAYLTSSPSSKLRPASSSENIWYSQIRNNYLYTNMGAESTVTLSIFSQTTARIGVYLSSGAPTGGYIYAADPSSTSYYPVVRQGNYLTYGYFDSPRNQTTNTQYEYGLPFFVNLVARMDDF